MAQNEILWKSNLTKAGIREEHAARYAKVFAENDINLEAASELDRDYLEELGVKTIGHILAITKMARKLKLEEDGHEASTATPTREATPSLPTAKPPQAKPPQAKSEMSKPDFRKFIIDWEVYKSLSNLPTDQIAPHLYNACESEVQAAIINDSSDFLSFNEKEMLETIEAIVTRRSNPMVHRVAFGNIMQSEGEAIKDFVRRLQAAAKDCEFTCSGCQNDLSEDHVKDQLIRGMYNGTLQTDVLAKAASLTKLEAVINHAEAFETAILDQSKLQTQESSDAMAFRSSNYRRQNDNRRKPMREKRNQSNSTNTRPCKGCGSDSHGSHAAERREKCPAWGKVCDYCSKSNHLAKVCLNRNQQDTHQRRNTTEDIDPAIAEIISEQDEFARAFVAAVKYDSETGSYTSTLANIHEIPANMTPLLRRHHHKPTTLMIFPDSGASICLAGPQHLEKLGVSPAHLFSCRKKVTAVGGSQLVCHGWLPTSFTVSGHTTKQPLYICDKVDRIYFSRRACTDVNILPSTFPYPMESAAAVRDEQVTGKIHTRPSKLPLPATQANVSKLRQLLVQEFKSVFTKTTPFPAMNAKPVHIHVKPDAVPYAVHTPIPVPLHWKEKVRLISIGMSKLGSWKKYRQLGRIGSIFDVFLSEIEIYLRNSNFYSILLPRSPITVN